MKKQRSASPSQAMPRSAPVERTRSMIIRRFSSSSGFGSWSGNSPSGTKYIFSSSSGSRSRIGPIIGPPIPLPPSTTTFIGLTASGSMKPSAWARYSSQMSTSSSCAVARRVAEPGLDRRPDFGDPGVAGERQRALADELHAGVGLRVVRGGHHRAAVEVPRADQVVEHLGGDHPGVDHLGALEDHPVAQLRRHLRRGQAHVAAEADPQFARLFLAQSRQDAHERAPDVVRGALVELLAVDATDVVGLEDARVQLHVRPLQHGVALLDRLRHHFRVRDHRHEVVVARPARHHVHVDVVLDPGAGDPPLVEADVVAVRRVHLLEPADRGLGERHHLGGGLGRDLLDRADVLVRRDHQVPVRVRVEVEDHEGALAAVDDQVALVVVLRGLRAEDALLLVVLGCVRHVGEAPRRPDPKICH